jgi:hypothetical protein
VELAFLEILGKAKSNVPEANNGARIYKIYVEPSIVDILRVGAHYAMSSLYEDFTNETKLYCFLVRRKAYHKQTIGKLTLVVGRAEIVSEVTWTTFEVYFALVHLGDHNFICGVDYYKDDAVFERLRREVGGVFSEGDVPRAIQIMTRYFGAKNYSLWHLFKYEQQIILDKIFAHTMTEIEGSFRYIYDEHSSLIRMLHENHIPLPKTLGNVAEFVLNRDLRRILGQEDIDLDQLEVLAIEMRRWPFKRDKENLDYLATQKINGLIAQLAEEPLDIVFLQKCVRVLRLFLELRLEVDLWKAQNIFYAMAQSVGRAQHARVALVTGEEARAVQRWLSAFADLGDMLKVKVM